MSTVIEHSTDELFPRTPNEYRPTFHFLTMKKERNIHGWIIRDVIENGRRISHPEEGKVSFHRVVEGKTGCFEWKFVMAFNSNGPNEVVTGYVPEFERDEKTQKLQYKHEFGEQ